MQKALKKPQFSLPCLLFVPAACLVTFKLHSQALQWLLHSTRYSWQVFAATEERLVLFLQFQSSLCSHLVACSIFYTSSCQTGCVLPLEHFEMLSRLWMLLQKAYQFLFINISYQRMLAKINSWWEFYSSFPQKGHIQIQIILSETNLLNQNRTYV